MAALVEGSEYGLSSLESTSANKSVLHVKLTDSALKAFEEFQKIKNGMSRRPNIQFKGSYGIVHIPIRKSSDNTEGYCSFRFSLSSIQGDPNGRYDCVQQDSTRRDTLESLGSLTHKISVHANDDVYQSTKQRMAALDVEVKKSCAKEIKASGPRIGHKVKKVVKHSAKLNGLVAGNHANSRPATTASLPTTFPGRPNYSGHGTAAPPSKPVSINKPVGAAHDSQRAQLGNRCSNGSQAKVSPNRSNDNELNGPIGSKNGGNPSKLPSDAAHGNQVTNRSNGYRGNPLKAKLDHGNGKSSPGLNGVNRHSSSVLNVPYRDRILHLLALKSYKKPEMLSRLQRDGIREKDKNSLGSMLKEIAVFNLHDNMYSLAKHMYNEVQLNYPFFSDEDRQLLKQRMAQIPSPSQANSPAVSPVHSNSSQGGSPQSQKRSSNSISEDDPFPTKKPRLAHVRKEGNEARLSPHAPSPHVPSPHAPSPHAPSPHAPSPKLNGETTPVKQACRASTPVTLTSSKHRQKQPGVTPQGGSPLSNQENDCSKSEDAATAEAPDYERKYKYISSKEQRYAYKADFNTQYDEYRRLHSSIEKVANFFEQLRQQLKQHEEGSDDYEVIKQRILSEYKQVKNKPKYVLQRQHCDHLHKKLGHIKSLILEYDNRQRSGAS